MSEHSYWLRQLRLYGMCGAQFCDATPTMQPTTADPYVAALCRLQTQHMLLHTLQTNGQPRNIRCRPYKNVAGWNEAYLTAIRPLNDAGILVVAAAGNEAIDMDNLASLGYAYNPCLVPLPNVLCVAASNADDTLASFSNYGPARVHIAAPGVAVQSTTSGECAPRACMHACGNHMWMSISW